MPRRPSSWEVPLMPTRRKNVVAKDEARNLGDPCWKTIRAAIPILLVGRFALSTSSMVSAAEGVLGFIGREAMVAPEWGFSFHPAPIWQIPSFYCPGRIAKG